MSDFNFTQWISVVGPLATLYGAVFYMLREDMNALRGDMKQLAAQHRDDLRKLDDRWADLLKGFYDFKNVTVERFSKLENEGKR